ncbi:MAG: fluoride efflux transporter CrcB [Thermoflavifilum sp.]|nr:fluoride efflux transporter CrcB [Thermoflavifilum sp.]
MYRSILLVGIGSFAGGILRFLFQSFVQRHYPFPFPLGTLLVNVSGCFLIGIIYGLTAKGGVLSSEMRLLLATGVCGGYTTFSSFAYENVSLLADGEWFYFGLYSVLSFMLGLAAAYAGAAMVRLFS